MTSKAKAYLSQPRITKHSSLTETITTMDFNRWTNNLFLMIDRMSYYFSSISFFFPSSSPKRLKISSSATLVRQERKQDTHTHTKVNVLWSLVWKAHSEKIDCMPRESAFYLVLFSRASLKPKILLSKTIGEIYIRAGLPISGLK